VEVCTRVVYFYECLGNAERPIAWDSKRDTVNKSAIGLETEGFWYLWKTLLERKILDEVLVIVESARSPGYKQWKDNYSLYVIPHINQVDEFLRPDDVLFVRSGYRTWFAFLERIRPEKRWVLFYRAASNRAKWGFWDIVLEDLTDKSFVFGDKLHYRFNKPTHPDIFKFRDRTIRDIDVMFHASHIHDKKGQWKCVDAAIAYREMYGKDFIGVMPGGFYGGEKTREAYKKIEKYKLPIWVPGMVPKDDLNRWMSRSKLYLHLGGAGQNDRGNLESMLCGCQQLIGNLSYHPPFVYSPDGLGVVINDHSPRNVAEEIGRVLSAWTPHTPFFMSKYYQEQNGVDVSVRQMEILFDFIKRNPIPDRQLAIKELMNV
jgi:hypothetical protein